MAIKTYSADMVKLNELETKVRDGFMQVFEALEEIRTSELWRLRDVESWAEYLFSITGYSLDYYGKLKRAVESAQYAEQVIGLTFKNLYAARAFRASFQEWIDNGWLDEFADAFVSKANSVGIKLNGQLQAKHVHALAEVMTTILRNNGYLHPVDSDEMTAFDAAVHNDVRERIMRQNEHIAANSRKQWNKAVFPRYTEWEKGMSETWDEIVRAVTFSGLPVEIRWAVIEEGTGNDDN